MVAQRKRHALGLKLFPPVMDMKPTTARGRKRRGKGNIFKKQLQKEVAFWKKGLRSRKRGGKWYKYLNPMYDLSMMNPFHQLGKVATAIENKAKQDKAKKGGNWNPIHELHRIQEL